MSEKITLVGGKLNVPENPIIPFIEGDGTGPDITRAAMVVWNAAVEKAYGGQRKIEWKEVKKEFLTLAEVKQLVATPCKIPVLKQAVLFSCMTGLRISDILQLSWEHIQMGQDGGYLIRLCTEKTEEETNLPISDETLALCGERSEGLVFKGLKRHMVNHPMKEWIKSAGLTRRITFHTMRHSFATLLAANGVDILTISRMLTHKSVKNTQIYAKVVDERAREASQVISLK